MRVLHLITGLDAGGAENQLLSLHRALHRAGCVEQRVVSILPGGALREAYRNAFGEVHQLDTRRGALSLRTLRNFRGIVRASRPDVIHAWMYHACAVAVAAQAGVATVWGIRHGLDANRHLRFRTRVLVRALPLVSYRPTAIVFNSQASREQHRLLGYPSNKAHVIHNGVDAVRFSPDPGRRAAMRRTLGVDDGRPLVGYVGRLHSVKGWDLFCETAADLHRRLPGAVFVMAGADDKSNARDVRTLAADLGLTDNLRIIGHQADVVPLMCALDLLIVPSRSEGFPNVVTEAMACGVTCVATDVGDVREIVGDCATVVSKAVPAELADAAFRMLEQGVAERAVIGAKARRRVIERFSLETAAAHYASLYRQSV